MKTKTVFVCQNCGSESAKWQGKCSVCDQWNSYIEEKITQNKSGRIKNDADVKKLKDIQTKDDNRTLCDIAEFDRILGGGLVAGSVVLVGGDPGIGKSTILLQVANRLCKDKKVLYVSGEESENQIKMRADRIGVLNENLYLLCQTDIDLILECAKKIQADVVIADSIQTSYSSEISSVPGSVTQIRECCFKLTNYAKTTLTPVFIVGHVTKDGAIAGPKILEHMVDTVLYFEGDQMYRILRAVKNRYGSTNEIGIFEMKQTGLLEVENPSAVLLCGRPQNTAGSVIFCALEGTRAILTEIQALVTSTSFGIPRRMTTGVDYNRTAMLIAIMEKKMKISMANQDAYINVVGGMKMTEPACDLAIICAIYSSLKNICIPDGVAVMGEVGLTGEVRSVANIEKRISELEKLGFIAAIVPHDTKIKSTKIELRKVKNISEVSTFLR